jgi:hypothetical protein
LGRRVNKQDFFDMADAKLGKSQDYLDFKRCVDEQIQQVYSLEFYLKRLQSILRGDLIEEKLVSEGKKAILSSNQQRMRKVLERNSVDEKRIDLALRVIQTGSTVAAMF